MAYSRITKIGDGVTNQFAVNFTLGYLKRADITCRVGNEVDGLGDPTYRTITFVTDNLLQISGAVPSIGEHVVFDRTTEKAQLVVDFSDGDVLDEENLDKANLQTIMLVHEVLDGRFSNWPVDDLVQFGKLYLGGRNTDPTTDNDGLPLQEGALYYNLVIKELRYYNSGVWRPTSLQALNMVPKRFTTTPGQISFPLDMDPIIAANLLVWVDGVRQVPELDYDVAGSAMIVSPAYTTGTVVDTLVIATTGQVSTPTAGSIRAIAITNIAAEQAAIFAKIADMMLLPKVTL